MRNLVTVLAVALGVALTLAIDLANASAITSFSRTVNVVASRVNLQILGIGRGFDERTLLRVLAIPSVESAAPVIEDNLIVGARRDAPLSGEVLRVLGIDTMQPLPRDAGNETVEDPSQTDRMVNGRGVIISRRVADRYGLRLGSALSALAETKPVTLVVAGILPPSVVGIDSSVAFVDIATAQDIFAKAGLLDRIDCVIGPNEVSASMNAIRAALPRGVRAVTPATRTGEIQHLLQSFQLNLAALSAIALVVGMYLIFNTVAIAVVERRSEIGTLRALGAKRRQIFAVFVIEGAFLGMVGSVCGLALGAALAQFSVGAVTRTVQTVYIGIGTGTVVWDPGTIAKAFFLGVVLAMVAAVVPALEAASVPPAIAMRSRGFEQRSARFASTAALAGLVMLGIAALLAQAPAMGGVPVFGYLSGIAIMAGGSLCVPLCIQITSNVARRGLRAAPAILAIGNMSSALGRESVAVAALAIAIAMMTSVAILVGSFRATVVAWANDVLKADLFVRPLGPADASAEARFPPSVVVKIARVPGVASVHALREMTIPFDNRLVELDATDFTGLARRNSLELLDARRPRELLAHIAGKDEALISEPFATRFGVRPGDEITIETPSGPLRLGVAAIFNDYSSDSGIIIIDRPVFVHLFRDDTVNSIAIFATAGTDLNALRTQVIRSVLPLRIDIETNRELRDLVIQIFNRTFAITYALYLISVVIALLGVVSTLFALVLERRRQIGVLRYLGLRTREVRSMVLVEAALVGALGAICGIAIGALLALLLIFVINRQAFGWLIELHVPWAFLAVSFVLTVAAAVIAGLYPAGVAARIRTAEAVRTE